MQRFLRMALSPRYLDSSAFEDRDTRLINPVENSPGLSVYSTKPTSSFDSLLFSAALLIGVPAVEIQTKNFNLNEGA